MKVRIAQTGMLSACGSGAVRALLLQAFAVLAAGAGHSLAGLSCAHTALAWYRCVRHGGLVTHVS